MQNIKDIPIAEFPKTIEGLGLKKFAASQIIQWIYKKGATSFDEMTNLSMDARKILKEKFYLSRLELVKTLESSDGTKKFAWQLADGKIIESVLIPAEHGSKIPINQRTPPLLPRRAGNALTHQRTRLTLCISTQVGCAMGCVFCRTAEMGFVRNLTQGEIVDQILEVQIQCHPLPHPPPSRGRDGERGTRVTNVVLMGMGEPLANYDNVVSAIRIMTDTKCLGLSKRHVTLSTSGLVPEIERLAKEGLDIKLAISLNATTDEARSAIMPVNKKYPLALLSKALKKYAEATGRHRLTFEYVVIDGQNDSAEDAKRLVKLLSHIKAKVNLIPLNAMPPHPPSEASIQRFAQLLRNKNIQVNIRNSRGADILAACGQLSGGTTRS
ncbi:MAG: 23S rRNA (adenine(2503)-C(2))-methyltransferase RlmN [Deltaproteobacteria bacterium]|nr:23S rRNA (adenine(2503)-C(2))-methyltransferase RlmN [Deltaproteobacteria bacterium]